MPGRTPPEAVNAFLGPMSLALSCVTDGVLDVAGGYHVAAEPHRATLNGNLPVRLRCGTGDAVELTAAMRYRVLEADGPIGPWKVQTATYIYELTGDFGRIGYHWHPDGRSPATWPHVHVSPSDDWHLPTGRISLEQVLRLAIEEFDVIPRRDDWAEVLARTQGLHESYRTWHAAPPV